MLHCYNVILFHCYFVTLLLWYIVTLLQCYIVTLLLCYIVALLHCYNVALLNRCSNMDILKHFLSRIYAGRWKYSFHCSRVATFFLFHIIGVCWRDLFDLSRAATMKKQWSLPSPSYFVVEKSFIKLIAVLVLAVIHSVFDFAIPRQLTRLLHFYVFTIICTLTHKGIHLKPIWKARSQKNCLSGNINLRVNTVNFITNKF